MMPAELQLAPHADPPHPSTSTIRIMAPHPPPATVSDDFETEEPAQVKSNQIVFVTYACLADVIAGVVKCLCL